MTRFCLLIIALAAPLASAADTATTQPSRPPERPRFEGPFRAAARDMRRNLPGQGAGGAGAVSGAPVSGPMTDEERADIEQFMKAYSPKRWDKLQDIPDTRRDKILLNIRNQYAWMQRLKTEDPTIYDIRIKRIPIEDEMFALGWELHHSDSKSPQDLRNRLREQVRLFVSNSLEERRARIDRWRDRLKQEQDWFDKQQSAYLSDVSSVDALIEKGVDAVESERGGELKSLAGPLLGPRAHFLDTPPATRPATGPAE